MPTNFSPQDFLLDSEYVDWSIRERERDLQTVANFAATQKVPIIVLGDFNTSDQSDAYHAIANVMTDAWREKGWGLGHTFPAPDSQGNSRIVISGLALPTWLVRIDFVFHSRQWQTVSAQLGPWDGFSDHRPVIAELTLNEFLVK